MKLVSLSQSNLYITLLSCGGGLQGYLVPKGYGVLEKSLWKLMSYDLPVLVIVESKGMIPRSYSTANRERCPTFDVFA